MKYLVVLMVPLLVFAGSVTKTFTFSPYEITSSKVNGYDFIYLGNELYTSEPGSPSLPELSYSLLVPPTAEVTGIEVISYKVKDIPGAFNIFPAQPARPLSEIPGAAFVAPNPAVYASRSAYPGQLAAFVPTGCMSGYRIAGVMVYPVQYIPAEQKLKLYTEITVRLNYEEGRHELVRLSKSQVEFFGADVQNQVVNPEMIDSWAPGINPLARDSADLLIITGSTYVSAFAPIANWRSKKGYYTRVLPTDSANRYPGRDQQEKIRNLIIDHWQTKGTKWVLLGGDVGVVPYRPLRCISGGYTGNIPSDLYYADLQWSYDGNRNGLFGEMPYNGDTVDLYYDVYIGRACLDNATELGTFIKKDTIYEKRPDPNYLVRLFLPQGTLWSGWPGDSTQNMLARYPPVPPWVIRKMYERFGQISQTACTETLRTGVGFCHMVGHGNTGGVYMGSGSAYATSSSLYNLTNTNKYIIANSNACDAGAFDVSDCLAENFVLSVNGGAVADIYNSRYGWGYATGPAGPSEIFDLRFYSSFFQSETLNFEVGKVNCVSKQAYRNSAFNQAVYRWCYYELNLLGDPALAMWSRTPLTLTVTHPGSIGRGVQNYAVQVRSSGNPLARAAVCLWKGDEVYARGATDATGNITLSINPTTGGAMSVTVTAKSHLPYEGSTMVGVAEEKTAAPRSRSIGLVSNPVRNRLVISYSLPSQELVSIRLFDATGRQVGMVARGNYQGVGQIVYRPANLASGVYFVHLETAQGTTTQSVLFVK